MESVEQAIQVEATYFLQSGPKNTGVTLQLAKKRADELGVRNILVASTRGRTAAAAAELFQGYNLVIVTHSHGFSGPNTHRFEAQDRQAVEQYGAKILTTTHALGGMGRAIRRKFGAIQLDEVIAHTLRIFGQGMKVCAEIAVMAADSGLVRTDEDAIAISGTGRGADTAVVIRPANTQDFFDLRIKEIICKPRLSGDEGQTAQAAQPAQAATVSTG